MELRSRTIGKSDTITKTPSKTPSRSRPSTTAPTTTPSKPVSVSKSAPPLTPSSQPANSIMTSEQPSGNVASSPTQRYSLLRITAAWLVHLYTATGLLVNIFSLLNLLRKPNFELFCQLNWLAIAIDATDGTFARAVDIKKVIPTYDGAMLDNIIDFQTFSVLPALAVIVFEIVPGTTQQMIAASAILLASAYQFCQTVAKTPDAFVGFPSYWNIVLFYLYYLKAPSKLAMAIIFACAILSFIPIHFIYPTRTKTLFTVNLLGAYVWSAMLLVPAVFPDYPHVKAILWASFVYVIYYIALSVHLDIRRRKEECKSKAN